MKERKRRRDLAAHEQADNLPRDECVVLRKRKLLCKVLWIVIRLLCIVQTTMDSTKFLCIVVRNYCV